MNLEHIIVASIGFLASTISVSFSYYFTKKHQLKMEGKRLKEEYYKIFIKAISDVAINNYDNDAQKRFSESFNSLIVIGSPLVVMRLMNFHDFVKCSNVEIPRDSNEWISTHDKLLRDLICAMREDIYGKEKNIDKYISNVHLVGKAPEQAFNK